MNKLTNVNYQAAGVAALNLLTDAFATSVGDENALNSWRHTCLLR